MKKGFSVQHCNSLSSCWHCWESSWITMTMWRKAPVLGKDQNHSLDRWMFFIMKWEGLMVRCSISRVIYNLITLRVFLHSEQCCEIQASQEAPCCFVIAVTQGGVTKWWEHLGCTHCDGGPVIPFLGLVWHLSLSAPHCCWKQKLLSNFQTQSGALWASAGKTGSTSLAAEALASCLPWIGTSRDLL